MPHMPHATATHAVNAGAGPPFLTNASVDDQSLTSLCPGSHTSIYRCTYVFA